MNVRESVSHEQAVELLPWLVNDSLGAQEQEAVRAHAKSCVICRRELLDLEETRDSIVSASDSAMIPEPDMRNINARIDALIDRQNRGRELLSRLREVFDSPWRIAFAAQTVFLIVLAGVLFWPEPRSVEFTTLTETQNLAEGQYIRVVFSPDLQQPQINTLLDAHALTIVDGPSMRGVYTLGFANTNIDDGTLLSSLQANSNVLFAEPVVIGAE